MNIIQLQIRRFMAMGEADLNLDKKGLVLISGVNEDDSSASSNGAGKSTVADAMSWALYGNTARGESGDNIVNKTVGKNTYVRVSFEDSGEFYSITRYRKHSKGKNRVQVQHLKDESQMQVDPWEAEGTTLTLGTDALTQVVIDRLVGCSASVFNSVVYLGQESMPNLPAMTDKNLKELVEEAAGITILQDALKEARSRMTAVSAELDTETAKANTCVALLQAADESLRAAKSKQQEFNDGRKSVIANAEASVTEATKVVAEVKKDFAALAKATRGHEAKIDELRTAIAGRAVEDSKLKQRNEAVKNASVNLAKKQEGQRVAAAEVKRLKARYDSVEELIGTDCGECGKTIELEDTADARKAAKVALKESVVAFKNRQEGAKDSDSKLAESTEIRDTYQDSMTDVSVASESIQKLSEELYRRGVSESHLESCKVALKERKGRLAEETAAANPFDSVVSDAATSANKALDDSAGQNEIVKAVTKRLSLAKDAVAVFGPAGVRAHILDTVTPYLNGRTDHYLSLLSDGNLQAVWNTVTLTAKGEAREKFHIEAFNKTMATESFGMLSGGEKRKVRLACAMALQDVVSSRAEKPINILMADEIDDALDGSGLERLMSLLDEKARERGTLLVISHNELSDWVREVCTVTRKEGMSTMEGPLCL